MVTWAVVLPLLLRPSVVKGFPLGRFKMHARVLSSDLDRSLFLVHGSLIKAPQSLLDILTLREPCLPCSYGLYSKQSRVRKGPGCLGRQLRLTTACGFWLIFLANQMNWEPFSSSVWAFGLLFHASFPRAMNTLFLYVLRVWFFLFFIIGCFSQFSLS